MKIERFENYNLMSNKVAQLICSKLKRKPDSLICAASGGSPLGAYHELVKEHEMNPNIFRQLKIVKLDEWGGIPMTHPQTCETFLQEKVILPLGVTPDRYFSFNSNSKNNEKECRDMELVLKNKGPIDICILGLGMNGHIAFNEPAPFLSSGCHVAELSEKSLEHTMAKKMEQKPTCGLTLGMADILQSKQIILLVTGKNKEGVFKKLLSEKITTTIPASFLWLHQNVTCVVNESDFSGGIVFD